jgi:hypothetical protein
MKCVTLIIGAPESLDELPRVDSQALIGAQRDLITRRPTNSARHQ